MQVLYGEEDAIYAMVFFLVDIPKFQLTAVDLIGLRFLQEAGTTAQANR